MPRYEYVKFVKVTSDEDAEREAQNLMFDSHADLLAHAVDFETLVGMWVEVDERKAIFGDVCEHTLEITSVEFCNRPEFEDATTELYAHTVNVVPGDSENIAWMEWNKYEDAFC